MSTSFSSFKAEGKTPAWWNEVITRLETTHNVPIRFTAVFLNASDANLQAFKPFTYTFSNWGVRTPSSVKAAPNYAAKAHALGRKWMAPVTPQDMRTRSMVYAEANNTELLRTMWSRANSDNADSVQIVTWNDYMESSQVAPTVAHGTVFLDVMSYYARWFKQGTAPAITSDQLYVTHRGHLANVTPKYGNKTSAPTLGGSTTPPRNTVEGLVFLTAPATLTLTSGGTSSAFAMPAGISAVTVPLKNGTVSAKITRGATEVANLTSPYKVTATPEVLRLPVPRIRHRGSEGLPTLPAPLVT